MSTHFDCIISHRGTTVPLYEHQDAYVYLLHYHRSIGNHATPYGIAQHYVGATGALDCRLSGHKAGTSGAALPQAFHDAGIGFTLARLWRFETAEEAFAFEQKLKRAGHSPRYCPICRGLPVDEHVFMRQGHRHFRHEQARPRRPLPVTRNRPMQ